MLVSCSWLRKRLLKLVAIVSKLVVVNNLFSYGFYIEIKKITKIHLSCKYTARQYLCEHGIGTSVFHLKRVSASTIFHYLF